MSRITEKGATGGLSLFKQAYSANPANTPATTAGTGDFNPDLSTCVGQKFDLSDGREVVLVQVGITTIAAGKLVQAPVEVTAFEKLAMTVPTAYPATAGTFQVLVTNGATVLKVNQYQGGYFVVASGTGIGQTLKIASHAPAANGATFVVTLEDAILTTLDATSIVTLQYSPYGASSVAGVLISNHTTLGLPVGVTLYSLTGSTAATFNGTSGALSAAGVTQYGFIQTRGPVGCLIDTLTNVGYPVGPSTATDGALAVATLTSSPQVGISGQTQTSTDVGIVYLQL